MGVNRDRMRAVSPARTASVEIVIPVYNEESALPISIPHLTSYLSEHCPYEWRVTIADNASIDQTPRVCRELAQQDARVMLVLSDASGSGARIPHSGYLTGYPLPNAGKYRSLLRHGGRGRASRLIGGEGPV